MPRPKDDQGNLSIPESTLGSPKYLCIPYHRDVGPWSRRGEDFDSFDFAGRCLKISIGFPRLSYQVRDHRTTGKVGLRARGGICESGMRRHWEEGNDGFLWCMQGVQPSWPIGTSRAASRAAGKSGSGQSGTQAGPNPYTRATKGQKKETRSNPTRAELQEPKAREGASREKGKGEGNSEQTEMLQVVPENQNKWEEPVVQVTEPSGPRKIAIELASNEWSVKLGRARNPQQWAVMAERRTIHECANHRGERRQRLRATGEVEGAKTKTKEYIYPMQVPLAQMVEYGNGGQPGEAWRKRMRNDSEGKHGTCGLQSGFVDEEHGAKTMIVSRRTAPALATR
ncbi:hypothetical protein B0H13DRAFT_1905382 [Mycena leptocephala]|nr:hypothetical protein B0H13DRAFT_1905382 [Mycena leptocephala]